MAEQAVQATEDTISQNKNTEENIYQMDLEPLKVKISVFSSADRKQEVTHVVRRPTFAEEEARERMMPLIISDAGKVDGADASSMSLDDEAANVRMYDKIALSVNGYALEQGKKPTGEDVSVDTVLNIKGEDKTIRELIPPSHKSAVITGLFPSTFEVDVDEGEFYFALGGDREWKVKQEIGGKYKLEDGTLAPADYTIQYIFREPTQEERKKFRNSAVSALSLKTTSGSKERRSTNLRVVSDLFDALIQTIDGATIAGTSIDTRDKKQLALIPATFKKGAIIRLMNFLEADLSD